MGEQENPWLARDEVPRGADYDARFARVAESGQYMHGEADRAMAYMPRSVLDAGCGTGRVAIELARRGVDVVGVDLDPQMLAVARRKAPLLEWVLGDLAEVDLGRPFDVVLAAGNVMTFLTPGTEEAVVGRLTRHLSPGGLLVAGFQLKPGGLALETFDAYCATAGLHLRERHATWEGAPYLGGDYAVSVHAADMA